MLLAECVRCNQLFQTAEEDYCPGCLKQEEYPQPQHPDQYRVVSESSLEDLQTEVNKLLLEGWTTVGGVTKASAPIGVSYLQAMVRRSSYA